MSNPAAIIHGPRNDHQISNAIGDPDKASLGGVVRAKACLEWLKRESEQRSWR